MQRMSQLPGFSVLAALAQPLLALNPETRISQYGHTVWRGQDGAVAGNPTALAQTVKKEVILVGHTCGGAVISEAGNDPKVVGLVYITAFALDKGESVASLLANPAPDAPVPPLLPPVDGFLLLDREKFPASFAADVNPSLASFMADSQVPWGLDALQGAVSQPAWRSKPSWYLVTKDDKMIPPPAQRAMAERAAAEITETPGSHSIFLSNPEIVASVIKKAAVGVPALMG